MITFLIDHARKDGAVHAIEVGSGAKTEGAPAISLTRKAALALAEEIITYYQENSPRRNWKVDMNAIPFSAPAYLSGDDLMERVTIVVHGEGIEMDEPVEVLELTDEGIEEGSEENTPSRHWTFRAKDYFPAEDYTTGVTAPAHLTEEEVVERISVDLGVSTEDIVIIGDEGIEEDDSEDEDDSE